MNMEVEWMKSVLLDEIPAPAPLGAVAGGHTTEILLNREAFEPIDLHFGALLERLNGQQNALLRFSGALVSRARRSGHSCLDLRRLADVGFAGEMLEGTVQEPCPALEGWETALKDCAVVGEPGEFKPLVLDGHGRLYLHRAWHDESQLAQAILARAGSSDAPVFDEELLQRGLRRYFPSENVDSPQALAAATAVRRRFTVIAGGPGTGKTRTVAMVLALLLEQAGTRPCRIALAAPTGKAAARLQESLARAHAELPFTDELKTRLPSEAGTVHRLLGIHPDSSRVRYDARNPLPVEAVVVDEASMVDLGMMARLFAAVPTSARLILLGDKDQLASVEAGSVLGDLCQAAAEAPGPFDRLGRAPLAECTVWLEKNYRFGPNHGLLALSRAVNAGQPDLALPLLAANSASALRGVALPVAARLKPALRQWVLDAFRPVVQANDPAAALQALAQARLLVALKQGPYGVEGVNALVEKILVEAGLVRAGERWYAGRPVMVTRNDYQLGLFNGDIGVILPAPDTGELCAWFPDPSGAGALRAIAPARLPEHQTVFAMTVHKSQGSEFDKVLFLLPDRLNPVLTRELIYTGITRARRQLELWFNEPILRAAIQRRAERTSGLRDALLAHAPV
jgi:exodeoxyribonuclease V alpha subunit